MSPNTACESVLDELDDLVSGNPDAIARHSDHLAGCDDCRDARHEASQLAAIAGNAGHDYVPMADLEARILAKIDAHQLATGSLPGATAVGMGVAEIAKASTAEIKAEAKPEAKAETKPETKVIDKALDKKPVDTKVIPIGSRRSKKLVAAAAFAAVAAAGVGFYAVSKKSAGTSSAGLPIAAKDGSIGKVEKLERAAKDGADGVSVLVNGKTRPLRAGETVPAGATVKTDDRTRISLVMSDGTKLVLDHQTAVAFAAGEPRDMRVDAGRMVADVAHVDKRPASITTPNGKIDVVGTRFSVTATDSLTTVQVVRGAIVLNTKSGDRHEVRAGEEGTIENGKLEVSSAPNLGREVEWSELAKPVQNDTASAGLGSLRAYKPGEKRDRDWNLALASHDVKVRISGPVARTEITETFRNDTANQLEGVYQFPLPADAQIDSLELDVKDGFMQGAFVDKERAAKIWRGVIDKATPKIARKPTEDVIWVQGPWRDPALLDWKRGGRFELRIFPIPAKGARTIKIAYTQVVKPRGAWRQYVYPLPHSADGSTVADKFGIDVEVRGGAQGRSRATGYALVADPNRANVDAMTLSQSAFVPRGDLVIDYRADSDAEVRAWSYTGGAAVAPDEKLAAKKGVGNDPKVVEAQKAIAGDARPTAVIALKPKLPRWDQAKPRDYMIVVDTSQSMAGERMTRAAELASSMVGEMDRRDQFSIMACDSDCRRFDGGMRTPSNATAEEAMKWLVAQTAAGSSDVVGAIRAATTDFNRGTDRERWVIYVGDGFATTGFRKAADVEGAIATSTGSDIRVTTVGIGTDADAALLGAAARGGGGSYLAWTPGQTVHAAALASLESTYGSALRDAKIELPAGLADVAPTVLPTVRSGEEVLVAARVTGDVKGDVVVKGMVAGQPYEQRYPLTLAVSNAAGNGFVPRLWASLAIEQLERAGKGEDRARVVALSQGYGVMSKETSLLVLESQAMFDAFGVDRTQPQNRWTGEEDLDETLASGTIDYEAQAKGAASDDSRKDLAKDKNDARSERAKAADVGADFAGGLEGGGAPAPRPEPAATRPASAKPAKKAQLEQRLDEEPPRLANRAGMIAMRRSWVRVPSVGVFDMTSTNIRKSVDAAESALAANPDSREKHRSLVQALSYAGEIERARDVASRWLERDKLDPQALSVQADLLGRSGQRDLALRTLSGLVDLDADRVSLHERMIKAYENAGRMTQACSHRIAISAILDGDAKAAGAAMRCLRGVGRDKDAELIVRGLDTDEHRTAAEKASTVAPTPAPVRGDVVIDAHWSTGADVDVAIIAPDGSRTSWMGGAVVADSTSSSHETLAMRSIKRGNYLVEVTRNGNASGTVRGSLDLTVLGSKKTIPFEIAGSRATVGRINIALEQRLDRIWMDGVNCWLINPNTGARSKTRCPSN
jgi:tetratricopeptide (TPR) repeat protein